jgi:hypothetical protein
MPAKAPRKPRTVPTRSSRVDAPRTQRKAQRLPPAFALAWLHLLPKSVFPIRSTDDLATKISALLLPRVTAETAGHALPVKAQSSPRKPPSRKKGRAS